MYYHSILLGHAVVVQRVGCCSYIHGICVLQGKFFDSTVLDWSDVELVDLKFLESQPVVLVQFTVQQLNCIRDKHGNVVEGDHNSVHDDEMVAQASNMP